MDAEETQRRVLAMHYVGHPDVLANPVYGAWVAAETFFTALLRHGNWDGYECYVSPRQRDAVGPRLRQLPGPAASMHDFAELRRRGGELGFDAWHVVEPVATVPFQVRRRCATRPFPITLLHHTISYQNALHEVILPLLLADTLPCDSIVCTSTAARTALQHLLDTVSARFNAAHRTNIGYRGRLDLIPLGVDTDVLRPQDRRVCRRELMLPEEPLVVLWLGRVSASTKADLLPLIQAFADVQQYVRALGAQDASPPLLVIAGADPFGEQPGLAQQAQALGVGDQVRFFDHVDAFRKTALYGAADIFVAPTDNIQETFGITPVEAMACGVPQVVADWDGHRDTVRDGETGFLVPTLWMRADEDLLEDPFGWQDGTDHAAMAQSVAVDPARLRSALMQLILNPELRARMGAAARRRAEQEFSWPRVIARYEELWEDVGQVARGLPDLTSPAPDYQQPFFFDAFNHYATTIVDDTWHVRPSPSAAAALAKGADLAPHYADMDPAIMRVALELLDGDGTTVGEAVRHVQAALDVVQPEAAVRRQIMRLIKFGYLQACQ